MMRRITIIAIALLFVLNVVIFAASSSTTTPVWKTSDVIKDPFKWPFNGRSPKTEIIEQYGFGMIGDGEVETLLNIASGNSGLVQEIFFAHNSPANIHDMWLDVYYPDIEKTDTTAETPETGTTIHLTDASDFPTSGTVMITMADTTVMRATYTGKSGNDLTGCTKYPNTALAGGEPVSTISLCARFTDLVALMNQTVDSMRSGIDVSPGSMFDTDYFSIALNQRGYAQGYYLRYLMPYTNGIKIQLRCEALYGEFPPIWAWVSYQDTLPACWNRRYRLKGQIAEGTIANNSSLTFLNRPSGKKGVVFANFAGFSPVLRSTQLSDCQTAWTAKPNVTCTSPIEAYTGEFGSKCSKISVADAFTTGVAAYLTFAEKDLSGYNAIAAWVKTDITLADGTCNINLGVSETDGFGGATDDLPLMFDLGVNQMLRAGEWKLLVAPFKKESTNRNAAVSVGLKISNDSGPQNIWLEDVRAVNYSLEYLESNPHFKVNGSTERTWQTSGGEDYWGGAFYWQAKNPHSKYAGIGYHDYITSTFSTYHIHANTPIFYNDGIQGIWPNDFVGPPAAKTTVVRWLCLYYEEV
jgi:hypothetical protein